MIFPTYEAARAAAQKEANVLQMTMGIGHLVTYRYNPKKKLTEIIHDAGWEVKILPSPENRYGHETNMEPVFPQKATK